MQMHSVKSSQIKEIGHEAETLAVRFNTGALYHYAGVSAQTFGEFLAAASVGSFFGAHIKGVYEYQRINETKKEGE
ncbi:MAG: KTSC domain-containing protein [Rhodocyclaceae bacterium]